MNIVVNDRVAILVPCYNEARRIRLNDFKASASERLQLFFIDDGSKDDTYSKLQQFTENEAYMDVMQLGRNQGKGAAIRQGYLELKKQGRLNGFDWIGYFDADLSTPLSEVDHMLRFRELYPGNVRSIWGSRNYKLGSFIKRSALRHYVGRIFATLIHQLLDAQSYDTQCGAKLFRPEAMEIAFKSPFVSDWIFDVEILIRLEQKEIIECPLMEWQDQAGSNINFVDYIKSFFDIIKIRNKYLR